MVTLVPPTAVIVSPSVIPAFAAGEPETVPEMATPFVSLVPPSLLWPPNPPNPPKLPDPLLPDPKPPDPELPDPSP